MTEVQPGLEKTLLQVFNPQQVDVEGLVPVCENVLKLFLWTLTFIPFLNTWLSHQCEIILENATREEVQPEDLTQLKLFSFPSYYPERLTDPFLPKLFQFNCQRIEQCATNTLFSLCYAKLDPQSKNAAKYESFFREKVKKFCEKMRKDPDTLPVGKPDQTPSLPLSSAFLKALFQLLPSHFEEIKNLEVHGSIPDEVDQKNLKPMIQNIWALKSIRLDSTFFECSKKISTYFLKNTRVLKVHPYTQDNGNEQHFKLAIKKKKFQALRLSSDRFEGFSKIACKYFKTVNLKAFPIETCIDLLKKIIETNPPHLKAVLLPYPCKVGPEIEENFIHEIAMLATPPAQRYALKINRAKNQIILQNLTNQPKQKLPAVEEDLASFPFFSLY